VYAERAKTNQAREVAGNLGVLRCEVGATVVAWSDGTLEIAKRGGWWQRGSRVGVLVAPGLGACGLRSHPNKVFYWVSHLSVNQTPRIQIGIPARHVSRRRICNISSTPFVPK
jgi:hypothetical protein